MNIVALFRGSGTSVFITLTLVLMIFFIGLLFVSSQKRKDSNIFVSGYAILISMPLVVSLFSTKYLHKELQTAWLQISAEDYLSLFLQAMGYAHLQVFFGCLTSLILMAGVLFLLGYSILITKQQKRSHSGLLKSVMLGMVVFLGGAVGAVLGLDVQPENLTEPLFIIPMGLCLSVSVSWFWLASLRYKDSEKQDISRFQLGMVSASSTGLVILWLCSDFLSAEILMRLSYDLSEGVSLFPALNEHLGKQRDVGILMMLLLVSGACFLIPFAHWSCRKKRERARQLLILPLLWGGLFYMVTITQQRNQSLKDLTTLEMIIKAMPSFPNVPQNTAMKGSLIPTWNLNLGALLIWDGESWVQVQGFSEYNGRGDIHLVVSGDTSLQWIYSINWERELEKWKKTTQSKRDPARDQVDEVDRAVHSHGTEYTYLSLIVDVGIPDVPDHPWKSASRYSGLTFLWKPRPYGYRSELDEDYHVRILGSPDKPTLFWEDDSASRDNPELIRKEFSSIELALQYLNVQIGKLKPDYLPKGEIKLLVNESWTVADFVRLCGVPLSSLNEEHVQCILSPPPIKNSDFIINEGSLDSILSPERAGKPASVKDKSSD